MSVIISSNSGSRGKHQQGVTVTQNEKNKNEKNLMYQANKRIDNTIVISFVRKIERERENKNSYEHQKLIHYFN